jgi:hypothetical protein
MLTTEKCMFPYELPALVFTHLAPHWHQAADLTHFATPKDVSCQHQQRSFMTFRVIVRNGNPIPPRDREPGVNAINKAEFIGLASQGQAPTQTRRTG